MAEQLEEMETMHQEQQHEQPWTRVPLMRNVYEETEVHQEEQQKCQEMMAKIRTQVGQI